MGKSPVAGFHQGGAFQPGGWKLAIATSLLVRLISIEVVMQGAGGTFALMT